MSDEAEVSMTEEAETTLSEASQMCVSCGFCCDGTLFNRVGVPDDGERERVRRYGLEIRPTRGDGYSFRQPCTMHVDGACTIYEDRPRTCRTFRCSLLRRMDAGDVSIERAGSIVASAKGLARDVKKRLDATDGGQPGDLWGRVREAWKSDHEEGAVEHLRAIGVGPDALMDVLALGAYLGRHFRRAPESLTGEAVDDGSPAS
jgi:Putative zinc- or iron-chelating domain